METNYLNFAQFFKKSITIITITFMSFISLTLTGCVKEKHCNTGYPLYCAKVKVCCPAGYPYYCDGVCKQAPCPSGTVTVDACQPE